MSTSVEIRMDRFGVVVEGRPVLRMAQYPAAEDQYLYTVLAETDHKEHYAVWTFNSSMPGFVYGHYYDRDPEGLGKAVAKFNEKVAELDAKYLQYSLPRDAREQDYENKLVEDAERETFRTVALGEEE